MGVLEELALGHLVSLVRPPLPAGQAQLKARNSCPVKQGPSLEVDSPLRASLPDWVTPALCSPGPSSRWQLHGFGCVLL